MHRETITYHIENETYIGEFFSPSKDKKEKLPTILVAHAWMGRDQFAVQKAQALAELGYNGFAIDMYGNAQVVHSVEEATKLMAPLFMDRSLLQKRILAGLKAIQNNPLVDLKQIGAIGFCFGGLTVIELLRSGTDVRGVVAFHAALANEKDGKKAKEVPIAKNIKGSLLILHGYEDPLVSDEDLQRVQKELNDAKVDWQLNIYGHTAHAFTNPEVHDKGSGLVYNSKSSSRAWQSMVSFFKETFVK